MNSLYQNKEPVYPFLGSVYAKEYPKHKAIFAGKLNKFETRSYHIVKRMIDVLFSLFVIAFILSWLTPIMILLTLIDSGSPIFFIQKRIGYKNRIFNCYKLRTMTPRRHSTGKKITRIGHYLRYYKLDETPQFINVLKGEMSLVGPRPHMLTDHESFRRAIGSKYDFRHCVRPGITGLAQIKGYDGSINSLQKLDGRFRLDLFYLQKWSLKFEFLIIWLTILYFFRLKGIQNRV